MSQRNKKETTTSPPKSNGKADENGSSSPSKHKPSDAWLKFLENIEKTIDYIMHEMNPKQNFIKISQIAEFQKAMIIPGMLFLMWYSKNWSMGTFIYMALHGAYGITWNIKDLFMADKSLDIYPTVGALISTICHISCYTWLPISMALGHGVNDPSPLRAFLSIITFSLGLMLMMASDTQKHFTLKYRKGLIEEGFFARSRNINYLGEMMLYGAYGNMLNTKAAWAILIGTWLFILPPGMLRKEGRMYKKVGGPEYIAKSNFILPKVFDDNTSDNIFWAVATVAFLVLMSLQ